MIRTTVLGLGAMGAGMAANLHRAGLLAAAWNRTPEHGRAAAERFGFRFTEPLQAAVQAADLILTCVSTDADLLELIRRIGPLLQAGNVVVDTSTVSAETARQAAEWLHAHGVHFLDAPVSGGREGAEQGTLSIMVGGEAEVLRQVRPALEAIGSRITHMGPVGAGQATKAVNQIMVAGINQAVTEALAFALSQGLDTDRVIEAVSGGAAGNWFLDHRGRSMCEGRFEPGFRVALHHKDLEICRDMLAASGLRAPLVDETLADYARLMAQGHGDEDISALFRLKRGRLEAD